MKKALHTRTFIGVSILVFIATVLISVNVVRAADMPGVVLTKARFPSTILIDESNIQWFTSIALAEEGDEGTDFKFVVWLHIPSDWQLPWSRLYSFSGDFVNENLVKDPPAAAWVQNASNCEFGGAAAPGYKWQAWSGLTPQEWTNATSRLDNYLNLRGGLRVPSSSTLETFREVRVIVGLQYDLDGDHVLDSYRCNGAAQSTIRVFPDCGVHNLNGGFEEDNPSPPPLARWWNEFSSNGYLLVLENDDPLYTLPVDPHGGNRLAWLGGDKLEESDIWQIAFDVPADCPYLGFWSWFDSWETTCGDEFTDIYINSSTVIASADLCTANNDGGWVKNVLDLSAYQGTQLSDFGIYVQTDDDDNFSNVFLDDFAWQATAGGIFDSSAIQVLTEGAEEEAKIIQMK